MQGKILDYNSETQEGLIRGDDDNRYKFSGASVSSQGTPKPGQDVDFEMGDDGVAVSIYIIGSKGTTVMDTVSSSEGLQKAQGFIADSLKDGLKNKIALGLCAVAIISLFMPFISIGIASVSIIKHDFGFVALLLLFGAAGLFFTGYSKPITQAVVCLYSVMSAYSLYSFINDMSQGSRMMGANLGELLSYGFYVWLFSSVMLLAMALFGDYEKR